MKTFITKIVHLSNTERRDRWKSICSAVYKNEYTWGLKLLSEFLRGDNEEKLASIRDGMDRHEMYIRWRTNIEVNRASFLFSTLGSAVDPVHFMLMIQNCEEIPNFDREWEENEVELVKWQSHMDNQDDFLGVCLRMDNFQEIQEYFELRSVQDVEQRVTSCQVGYALAQAMDTAGVPFRFDFVGQFPYLKDWLHMSLSEQRRKICKVLQIGMRPFGSLSDALLAADDSEDEYENEHASIFTEQGFEPLVDVGGQRSEDVEEGVEEAQDKAEDEEEEQEEEEERSTKRRKTGDAEADEDTTTG